MAPVPQPAPRYYDLDALRAVAMFLGIVLHSSVFLIPDPHPFWPIHEVSVSDDQTYKLVTETIHGFRMPVFFLLSGYFSALLWQRRGLRGLVLQRLRRIGIPFVISCITVLPLSFWLLAAASGFRDPYDFPVWALPLLWLSSLGHLWFLWHLLLLTGCFVLAVWRGVQFRHPFGFWLVIPLSMGISLLMVEPVYGADNVSEIVPTPAVIAYYACFFVFGVFFYQRGWEVRSWWIVALLPAAVAFYAGFYLLDQYITALEDAVPLGEAAADYAGAVLNAFMFENPLTLVSTLVEAACAWLMCFGLMGLFRWVASRESITVLYFSDASYWTYLVHLPLVIAGQLVVVGMPVHYHFKFLIVCAGVTLIVLATYQFAVRYTIIGRTLNGPRTRRQQLPAAQPVGQG